MKTFAIAAALAVATLAAPVSAHAPHIGPKQGHVIHSGMYHFELVPSADAARLFLYSAANKKPAEVKGVTAKARVLSGGKMTNIAFVPVGGNTLIAKGAKLTGDWTALVTVTLPGKGASTLRYTAKDFAALRKAAGHSHAG